MGYLLKQSSTARPLVFLMVDSADHVSAKTGLTPTVTISKNGASFASPAGSVTEIGSGWYQVAGNATDTATLGVLALHATGSGADPTDSLFEVVAFDPASATNLGLSKITDIDAKTANLPSDPADASDVASSFSTVNSTLATVAGYIDTEVAAIKAKTDSLTFTVAGKVDANITHISGDSTAADNAEADYDGTGYNKSASTIGTANTIGTTGIAAIWSYAKASAAALATTTMGRYIYDKLALLTSTTTVSVATISSGTTIEFFKGSSKSVRIDPNYLTYALSAGSVKIALRKVETTSGDASDVVTGTITSGGTSGQYATFVWSTTDTAAFALSSVTSESSSLSPRYIYAYDWVISWINGSDCTVIATGKAIVKQNNSVCA